MKKLNVPYHGQEREYTCGPASLRMVFSYFDTLYNEQQLTRRAKTSKHRGTTRKRMVTAARKAGYWVYEQSDSTLQVVKWFINNEMPVIVNYIEPDEDEGHYTVVTGYDAKGLFLHDPWNGKDFHLARRAFIDRWRGSSEKQDRWLMSVNYSDLRPMPHTEEEEFLIGVFHDPL